MSIEVQVKLRTRKLGVLIRDARLTAHKSIPECAEAMGITVGILRAYEEGRRAPSLPELEILAYYLNLPMSQFWSSDVISDNASPLASINLQPLIGIRQRMIGALLRKQRLETGVSLKSLSEQSGISTARLKTYEMGESAIPASVLESLMSLLDARIESLFDQTGPIGQWLVEKKAVQEFLQLPLDLQSFVCKPVNRPYLELALSLSGLSTEKLRSVAESLLDITL
jgi:transcriptional regulator with XRE-family HTH domain